MTRKEIDELLNKYEKGQCSADEIALLHTAYNALEKQLPDVHIQAGNQEREIWADIQRANHSARTIQYWPAVAAAILLLTAGALYFNMTFQTTGVSQTMADNEDAPAGSIRATLILANGIRSTWIRQQPAVLPNRQEQP